MRKGIRKHNTQKFREIIEEALKDFQVDETLKEKELIRAWPVVTGPMFTRYTSKLAIQNRVLYVKLESSIVRNELMMAKEQLKDALNKHVKYEVIKDIVFR